MYDPFIERSPIGAAWRSQPDLMDRSIPAVARCRRCLVRRVVISRPGWQLVSSVHLRRQRVSLRRRENTREKLFGDAPTTTCRYSGVFRDGSEIRLEPWAYMRCRAAAN